jgi:4-hydroxy-2-oxoheptanedioate aldolase
MIDQQHGFFTRESFVSALRAAQAGGATAIGRVPVLDAAQIGAALDAGADGVVGMQVSPPAGVRSFGPTRASLLFTGQPADVNQQVLCIPLIETQAGAEAIGDICGCPGIDVIMIGPVDMAISMGLPVPSTGPRLESALEEIHSACQLTGIPTIIAGTPGETARRRAAQGHSTILLGSDVGYHTGAARKGLAESGNRP